MVFGGNSVFFMDKQSVLIDDLVVQEVVEYVIKMLQMGLNFFLMYEFNEILFVEVEVCFVLFLFLYFKFQ